MTENLRQLDLATIQSLLTTKHLGKCPNWKNELWDSIDSTNNRACELVKSGAPEGVIVLARQQTAGRGRQDRTWISPRDAGIYMSFVLRPKTASANLPLITIACGVACVKAIWDCMGVKIGLKWVNDLIANGKKIGGILAEIPSSEQALTEDSERMNNFPAVVLGIGINIKINIADLPDNLKEKVDCLESLCNKSIDPNLLVVAIAKHLEEELDCLNSGRNKEIISNWRQHSVTLGHSIQAISGSNNYQGLAIDIDEAGGLIVDTIDNGRVVLRAGEITIRSKDGSYS